ncbi:MAG: response regulator [Chloroflexi bacterium]|nr:response regulator [Chloroflexota bacterium]MBU1750267.1 response regulator [Chloroflexota bacterium]
MLDQVDAPRANILIVDDTPANLSLLSQMLAKQGYQVRPVPDGPLALTAAQAEPPDLVLLDIRMPDMDGYEVCEHLKAHPQTRDIPIIFVSALEDIKDKVKAFTAGGVDYVTKPFQVEEVLARVATHLALRDLQTQLERANQELTRQLTETRRSRAELQARNHELQEALSTIKTLKGLIPICAGCKKIRDDQGYWNHLEAYIMAHSDAQFSHGLCPDCARRLYPSVFGDEHAKGQD